MPAHLLSVLSKKILIPILTRHGKSVSYTLQATTVQEIYNIVDEQHFIHCAELALAYFEAHPEAKKLSRKKWAALFPGEVTTPCSFLKTADSIFVHSKKKIGEGVFSIIKLALKVSDADTTLYTVKIQRRRSSDPMIFDHISAIETEARIGLSQGYFVAPLLHRTQDERGREIFYLFAPYHGINLKQWIECQGPSNIHRLEAAITVAALIHQCHQTGIVLRDIKAENFLIDELRNVVTIDYGFALEPTKVGTKEDVQGLCGTPCGLPYSFPINAESLRHEKARVQQRLSDWGIVSFDTHAFKRLCLNKVEAVALLNSQKDSLPKALFERIDTSDVDAALARKDTVLEIGACLVLYRYQLAVPKARFNQAQQEGIMKIHFDSQSSVDQKRARLEALMFDAILSSILKEESRTRGALEEEMLQALSFFKHPFHLPLVKATPLIVNTL